MSGNYDFDAPTYGDFANVADNDNADAWFDNRQEDNETFRQHDTLHVDNLNNGASDPKVGEQDEKMEGVQPTAGEKSPLNVSLSKSDEDTVTFIVESMDCAAAMEIEDASPMSVQHFMSVVVSSEGASGVAAQTAMEGIAPTQCEISDKGGNVRGHALVSVNMACADDNTAEGGGDQLVAVANSDHDPACLTEEIREKDGETRTRCEAADEDGVNPLSQRPAEGNGSAVEGLAGDTGGLSEERGLVADPQSEAEGDQEESDQLGSVPTNLCVSLTRWRSRSTGAAQAAAEAPGTRRSMLVVRGDTLAGPRNRASVRKQLASIRAERRSVADTVPADRVSSPALKRTKRSGSFSKSSANPVVQSNSRLAKTKGTPDSEKIKAKRQKDDGPKRVPMFPLSTDQPLKQSAQVNEPFHPVDFIANLRKSTPASPMKARPNKTVPQPFKMMTRGSKRTFEEFLQSGALINNPTKGPAAFKSLAEQLIEFEQRTPQRFRKYSRKAMERGPSPVKALRDRTTMPITPQLATRTRHRSPTCKSTAQLEEEELARIQSQQFKARKLDPQLFEPGVVPVGSRRSHESARLAAETERRVRDREEERLRREEEERLKERATHEFHARPLPVVILEKVVGVPEKVELLPTVPESPAFALRQRVFTRKDMTVKQEEVAAHQPVPRANPMPHFALPFQPQVEMRKVKPEPFSFDSRDQERADRRERRIEEIRQLEEQVPHFKAQPLPDLDRVVLPEKRVRLATQVQPFHLRVNERGSIKTEQFNKKLKEDEEQLKEQAAFHARPCRVTTAAPFVARRTTRSLLCVENVELNTDRRARERAEYDARIAEQRRQDEAVWKLRLQEEAENERESNLRYRQEIVHKANPVRQYKSVIIHRSERPVTIPRSPPFSDRFGI